MHRSGTSLFSSYLQKCGLNIGESLIEPYIDNKKGYFEDIDFVSLNIKILAKNKTNMFLPKSIKINKKNTKEALKLLERKSKSKLWGWKDPRNTILLDFYKSINPSANHIFIFRHPYNVIDSLIRRGTDYNIRKNPFISAKSWILYNKKIIKFFYKKQLLNYFEELEKIKSKI